MTDTGHWITPWLAASEAPAIVVVTILAGAALGTIFFGGLWWTVQRGAISPAPARWFLASFILRTAIVLAGFYFVGADQLVPLGFCLFGFLLARVIVLHVTRPVLSTAPLPPSDASPSASSATSPGTPPCA